MNKLPFFAALLSLVAHAGAITVLIDEDFSAGQGDWAVRKQALAQVDFENAAVRLAPRQQPSSIYHTFNAIELADGEGLRTAFRVSVQDIQDRTRAIRVGIGYSDPPLRGTSEALRIPMMGYYLTFPTLGNLTSARLGRSGFVAPDVDANFFNVVIRNIGDIPVPASVGESPVVLVLQMVRAGDTLVFSGSIDGVDLSDVVIVSGDDLQEDFRFNTIGMSFAFTSEGAATVDAAKLEFLSERVLPRGLDSVFGLLTQLEEGRYSTRVFGVLQPALQPWILHEGLGWMYVQPNDLGNWAFSPEHGWYYISPGLLPWFWSQNQGWLYYVAGIDNVLSPQ